MPGMKDYYEILGVKKDASDNELRNSYQKLAKKYHPDKNPGNPEAEKKFKEAKEAYEILSDPNKRHQYEQFRAMGGRGYAGYNFNPNEAFGRGAPNANFQFEDLGDLGDLFGSFFNVGGRGPAAGQPEREEAPQVGEDIHIKLDVPFEVAVKGGKSTIRLEKECVCDNCQGSGVAPGSAKTVCPQCRGSGNAQVQQGLFAFSRPCPRCFGRGSIVQNPCKRCEGTGSSKRPRSFTVNIPTGIESGQKIKLSGEGKPGGPGLPPGDLYIEITVQPSSLWSRSGLDIISECSINLPEALLGASVPVHTLQGNVELKIPAGIQPGGMLRIREHGIQLGSQKGDHLVKIQVRLPKNLTPKQRELLTEFTKLGLD